MDKVYDIFNKISNFYKNNKNQYDMTKYVAYTKDDILWKMVR